MFPHDINKITFDPFINDISNIPATHAQFETIRTNCDFHEPENIKNLQCFEGAMSITHLNARSMVNKLDEILAFLAQLEHKMSFVCISETWLNSAIESKFCLGDEYKSFYKSRNSRAGGGSAIFAYDGNDNVTKEIHLFEFKTADVVTIQVTNASQPPYILCQMYRPPENDLDFLNELEQFLTIVSSRNILTYIAGDFNMDLLSITSNSVHESFFTLMCSYGFLPTISKATRISLMSSTLIDNIFTNDLSKVTMSGIVITDISDHFVIFTTTLTKHENPHKSNETKTIFDYKQIDNLTQYLITELDDINTLKDPERACTKIIEAYKNGIKMFSKTIKCSRKNSFIKPWMTPALLCSINHKNILFAKKLKQPSMSNTAEYNKYRNCLQTTILNVKKLYFRTEFTKSNNNPKRHGKHSTNY